MFQPNDITIHCNTPKNVGVEIQTDVFLPVKKYYSFTNFTIAYPSTTLKLKKNCFEKNKRACIQFHF